MEVKWLPALRAAGDWDSGDRIRMDG